MNHQTFNSLCYDLKTAPASGSQQKMKADFLQMIE